MSVPRESANAVQRMLPLRSHNDPPVDFNFLRPLKATRVFATYWRFAAERQRVFFKRIQGEHYPWTDDPVLQQYKFTNAYRASDRVSQYLIRNVIYDGDACPSEVFFRILLFKIFNRIETWELLSDSIGTICAEDFDASRYGAVLTKAMANGEKIYSAAYIMPSGGPKCEFARKHEMHLDLLSKMMEQKLFARIGEAKSMSAAFTLLKQWPTIGDFLAYQFVTDINYSNITSFSEMEFVVPGPGAKDGIRKCFSDLGGLTEAEVIKFITERQEDCIAAVGAEMQTLWGRPLQLIDCQNLFCEVDKYARVMHPDVQGISNRTRIKQRLRPSQKGLAPWYPPKWGLNERIKERCPCVPRNRR